MAGPIVLAGGYLPIGLWLGPTTCLLYTEESPDPAAVDALKAEMAAKGMAEIVVADDLRAAVLGITMAQVQDIGGVWAVWSVDEPTARAGITAAVEGEVGL